MRLVKPLLLSILLSSVLLLSILTIRKYKSESNEKIKSKSIVKIKVDMIEIESWKYPYFYVKGSGYTFKTLQLTFNVGDSLYVDEVSGYAYNPKTNIKSDIYED